MATWPSTVNKNVDIKRVYGMCLYINNCASYAHSINLKWYIRPNNENNSLT
jgi:hypothetical protein